MQITSTKNPLLQEIRQAAAHGRPTAEGWIIIEGPHLLGEMLGGRWKLGMVVTTPAGRERHASLIAHLRDQPLEVPARAFAQIASTESTQEILAMVRPPADRWTDMITTTGGCLTVVLDGIQDPGNAGTMIRSAEAFGATGVILLEGCVRVANGKFLRATAGSLFRLPVAAGVERKEFAGRVADIGMRLYALTASGETALGQTDLIPPFALVVGSEGGGVSPEVLARAKGVSIPTKRVESLNAAVACSLALFEAARQRGNTT
jgi:RNA methyltransferase, TrmH family